MELFETRICTPAAVLFLDCPEEVMQERLLKRAETSGRVDDTIAIIRKRFKTFTETTTPVIEHFRTQDKVIRNDAGKDTDAVYEQIQVMMEEKFGDVLKTSKRGRD